MNNVIQFPFPIGSAIGTDAELDGDEFVEDVSERSEMEAQLHKLRTFNADSIKNLALQGAQIQPEMMIMMRFDQIVDTLLGEDTDERLAFEIRFETTIKELMESALTQVFAAKLKSGTPAQGLVLPR